MFPGKPQPDAAVNQQRSKAVQDPVEALDQTHSRDDENTAHQHRAHNSPKQDAPLVLLRHREIAEDHEEEKKIVDAQGEFQDVAGNELKRDLAPLPEKNQRG